MRKATSAPSLSGSGSYVTSVPLFTTVPFTGCVTDATEIDSAGRFWVINYFYPGDRALLRPGPDTLGETFGRGPTHRREMAVERLVELALNGTRIEQTGRAPVQLELEAEARNWEGLARLGTRGFLVATDTYPETLLAFVPLPTDSVGQGVMQTNAP